MLINEDRPISTKAAAKYCGLGKSTLEKKRISGEGPEFLKISRSVRYLPSDLDRWLAEHRRKSTSAE